MADCCGARAVFGCVGAACGEEGAGAGEAGLLVLGEGGFVVVVGRFGA